MTRTTCLAVLAVAVLLLAGGTVLAKEIGCAGNGGSCRGTSGTDLIFGGFGDDAIAGRGGADVIFGDPLDGAAGDDIRGGAGNDVISDRLPGTDADRVFGGSGDDLIDVLEFDATIDVVDCGPGKDTVLADGTDSIADDCENRNPV